MNWGKGIILGMLLFMTFIVCMCLYMFNIPADDYDHQYYEKGLNFDKDYASEKLVVTDKAQPLITQLNHQITIEFKQPAFGTIKLINPLGKSKDVVFALNTGTDTRAVIPLKSLTRGRRAIRIEWSSDKKDYLFQKDIDIDGN